MCAWWTVFNLYLRTSFLSSFSVSRPSPPKLEQLEQLEELLAVVVEEALAAVLQEEGPAELAKVSTKEVLLTPYESTMHVVEIYGHFDFACVDYMHFVPKIEQISQNRLV